MSGGLTMIAEEVKSLIANCGYEDEFDDLICELYSKELGYGKITKCKLYSELLKYYEFQYHDVDYGRDNSLTLILSVKKDDIEYFIGIEGYASSYDDAEFEPYYTMMDMESYEVVEKKWREK